MMLSRVKVKAEVVLAAANNPLADIVLPLGMQDIVPPALEQAL